MESAAKDKLVADVKTLIADSEELLRASAGQAGEKISAARERIQASLATAKVKLGDAERAALEQAKKPPRRPTSTCRTIPGGRSGSPPLRDSCWAS